MEHKAITPGFKSGTRGKPLEEEGKAARSPSAAEREEAKRRKQRARLQEQELELGSDQ